MFGAIACEARPRRRNIMPYNVRFSETRRGVDTISTAAAKLLDACKMQNSIAASSPAWCASRAHGHVCDAKLLRTTHNMLILLSIGCKEFLVKLARSSLNSRKNESYPESFVGINCDKLTTNSRLIINLS